MNLTFKQMTQADVDEVVQVEENSFNHPWSKQSFSEEAANPVAYYLLPLQADEIIGYVGVWFILDEAHITNVAVLPEYRKQGIGEKMMREILRIAKARGVVAMTLEVRPSNAPALALYHKLGFVSEGIRKQYYEDNGEDAIIMWLRNIDRFV